MNNILSHNYLLTLPPSNINHITQVIIVLVWLYAIGAILQGMSFYKGIIPPLRNQYRRISNSLLIFLTFVVLFIVARYYSWPIISFRIWYIFIFILLIFLIMWDYMAFKSLYEKEKIEYYKEITKRKYLPKRKKK